MIGEPPLNARLEIVGVSDAYADFPKPWRNWFTQMWQIVSGSTQSGTTAQRPENPFTTQICYDTDLAKPIMFNGTAWILFDGTPA